MKRAELNQLVAEREAETGMAWVGWCLVDTDGTPIPVLARREQLRALGRRDLLTAAKSRQATRRKRLKRERGRAAAD